MTSRARARRRGSLLAIAVVAAACATPSAGTPSPSPPPSASAPCPVTPFGTIPPNDVVGWQVPEWQAAGPGIWAHPYLDLYDIAAGGFPGTDRGGKILWWTAQPLATALTFTISAIPSSDYQQVFTSDPGGEPRSDHPSGFVMPPAGCYQISVSSAAGRGVVVDRVLP